MFPESQGGCYLSIKDCQKFVDTVWAELGLSSSPKVSDGRGTRSARSWGDKIMLPKWSRNFTVLTHELAHCIADLIDSDDNHDHGGIFIYVYLTLLARYCGHKFSSIIKSASDSGIRVTRIKLNSRLKPHRLQETK